MKITLYTLTLLILLSAGCAPRHEQQNDHPPREVIIGMSPHLRDPQATILPMVSWLLRQPDCHVRVFDAWEGTPIAEFTVPRVTYFKEAAVARSISQPLQKWLAWGSALRTNSSLANSGAVSLPKFLDRLAAEHSVPQHLILIGSPVARFPGNPELDFAEPHFRYPSDAHVSTNSSSLFSSKGRERSLADSRVYFVFDPANTASWPEGYEGKLRRFYGRLFSSRSGNLVTLVPDLSSALRLVDAKAAPLETFKPESDSDAICMIDARASSPAPALASKTRPVSVQAAPVSPSSNLVAVVPPKLLSASKAIPPLGTNEFPVAVAQGANRSTNSQPLAAKALSSNTLTAIAALPATPPSLALRPAQSGAVITIRYRGDSAQADLFVRAHSGADEISYHNPATALGQYRYEFDSKTGEHVKSVTLPSGCEPGKAEVWINYSKGVGRLTGRVLLAAPDVRHDTPFSFNTLEGGDSTYRREYFRKRSDQWLRVNLFDLFPEAATPSATRTLLPGRPTSVGHSVAD